MEYKLLWTVGIPHIRAWTIFPWIRTDKNGWYFSWGFLRIARIVLRYEHINYDHIK